LAACLQAWKQYQKNKADEAEIVALKEAEKSAEAPAKPAEGGAL